MEKPKKNLPVKTPVVIRFSLPQLKATRNALEAQIERTKEHMRDTAKIEQFSFGSMSDMLNSARQALLAVSLAIHDAESCGLKITSVRTRTFPVAETGTNRPKRKPKSKPVLKSKLRK